MLHFLDIIDDIFDKILQISILSQHNDLEMNDSLA